MKILSFESKIEFKKPDSDIDFHWWDQNKTSLHTHDYYEIFVVTQGEIIHTLNGKDTKIGKRTLFFINPSDVHQFSPSENIPSQHINLSLTPFLLKTLCDALDPDIFHAISNKTFRNNTVLDNNSYEMIISFVKQLNIHKNPKNATILMKQLVLNILSILYRKTTKNSSFPEWFSELLSKIKSEEFMTKQTNEIYSLANYSQPMISYYFKKYLGESLISYFTKVKLNYACNLLSNTNFTILHISNAIGISSLSHFIKIFKDYTGMTPNEYRKKDKI